MSVVLSSADIRNLRKAIAAANEALLEIDRAERAGIDMSDLRAARDAIFDQANRLLQQYGQVSPQDISA